MPAVSQHPGIGPVVGGSEPITWQEIWDGALPTDPAPLEARIEAAGPPGPPYSMQLFESVSALLRAPTSPALRSALYQVAASIPTITDAGSATDTIGRAGTAFLLPMPSGLPLQMIIDPSTSAVLQTSVGSAQHAVFPFTYVASGFVDAVGDTPAMPHGQ